MGELAHLESHGHIGRLAPKIRDPAGEEQSPISREAAQWLEIHAKFHAAPPQTFCESCGESPHRRAFATYQRDLRHSAALAWGL